MLINGLTAEDRMLLIICIANLIIAVVYLLWGCLIYVPAKKQLGGDDPDAFFDNRRTFLMRFLIMLACPVTGICFFLLSRLTYLIFFHGKAHLTDVIFSKERVRQHFRDDEERERNMASIGETLLVGDKTNQRSLMMSVIQRDLHESLSSVVTALDSEDSETSHYAASALQGVFSDFRVNTQRLVDGIERENADESECEEMLIDYIGAAFTQRIFAGTERKRYIETLEAAGEKLFEKKAERFTPEKYEYIILCMLEQDNYEKAAVWCERLMRQFPEELTAYKCCMKLYFKMGDRDRFFELLSELKKKNITFDHEMIEIVRVYS